MTKSILIKNIASFTIIAVIFFFLGLYIYVNWAQIRDYEWNVNYQMLLLSLALLCVPFFMMAIGWYLILWCLHSSVNAIECVKIYTLSQLARYIPGKIFMFVGRVMMAERLGVKKSISALSVFFEAIISTAGAFFATLILYLFTSKVQIAWLNPYWIGFLIAAGLMAMNPKLLNTVLHKIYQLRYKNDFGFPSIEFRYYKIILLCLYYIIIWVLMAASFYLLIISFSESLTGVKAFFDITCVFLISWIIGFLSILTPGGLGVREGVMTIGLGKFLPLQFVSIMVIVSRIWLTIGELLVVAIAYVMPKTDPKLQVIYEEQPKAGYESKHV
jgi:uncharacterized membrane protein YbhN (UPF0104 family)